MDFHSVSSLLFPCSRISVITTRADFVCGESGRHHFLPLIALPVLCLVLLLDTRITLVHFFPCSCSVRILIYDPLIQ
jgi:hypothetical protein